MLEDLRVHVILGIVETEHIATVRNEILLTKFFACQVCVMYMLVEVDIIPMIFNLFRAGTLVVPAGGCYKAI